MVLGDFRGLPHGGLMIIVDPTSPPRGMGVRLLRPMAFASKAVFTHGSLVAVKNELGEYLFVRQNYRERGSWGFPGGFLNRGETPEAAAVRELAEETSVVVHP